MINSNARGTTLLETMMVLGLSATLNKIGIRLYSPYQVDLQLEQLKSNVDQLLEAGADYYKAQCATGALSPQSINYPPSALYPLNISTLQSAGYLNAWVPENAIVDSTGGGNSGYILQLNPTVTSSVSTNACVVITPGTACVPVSATPLSLPATQVTLVTWAVQVAVKIKNTSKINAYAGTVGADCVSGPSNIAGTVSPCSAPASPFNYLVWQRSPSYVNIRQGSIFGSSMPLLKQFNNQYTHDQNYEFNAGYQGSQAPVYYLCGG